MTKAEIEMLKELNEMYGTDVPIPKDIELDMDAVEFDMALGSSFDGAVQQNMAVTF